MTTSAEEAHKEIIIIRRGGGDEGAGHKGGTWKIAYADFVTAMMAFFLVMWLINSANEATKARVASYFNPIKMNDANPSGRGLNSEPAAKSSSKQEKKEDKALGGVSSKTDSSASGTGKLDKEEVMMADPFKALDSLAAEGPGAPTRRSVEIVTQKTGDPFDPMVWEALKRGKQDDTIASESIDRHTKAGEGVNPPDNGGRDTKGEDDPEAGKTAGTPDQTVDAPAKTQPVMTPQMTSELGKVVSNLKQQLDLLQSADNRLDGLNFDVKLTNEGILVALSDSEAVTMFRVGSAEPNPALVSFIGRIGQLLEQQTGTVIVRGYTDTRRFQSKKFDNWQLSTARAHMASYMLMRGGLSDKRLRKIEGYGETQLLDPRNPLSGVNRRVEFVLVPGS
jgi:chemotaxis protein MotB